MILSIMGSDQNLTKVAGQTLGQLSDANYRKGVLGLNREKEANDQKNAEIEQTLDLAKFALDKKYKESLIEKAKADTAKIQWENKTDREAHAIAGKMVELGVPFEDLSDGLKFKVLGSTGAAAVKKYYLDEKKYEQDVREFEANRQDKLADNIREDQKLSLDRKKHLLSVKKEERLSNPDSAESTSEALRRRESVMKSVGAIASEDTPMEQKRGEAYFFNSYADADTPHMYYYTPDQVIPGWFNDQEEEVTRVELPTMGGKQVTLGDMRTTAENAGITVELLYEAMLLSGRKQMSLADAIKQLKGE